MQHTKLNIGEINPEEIKTPKHTESDADISTKNLELQIKNEQDKLRKVIAQLPEGEKSELRKNIEKTFVLVAAGFMMFAATGCGQAGRQLDRGFGESVQRCFHDGLTERQQKSYEMEAKRIRDLRTRNINSKKMSVEEAERRYKSDMQTLDAAYDALKRK
ncbi:MAG TPA: hypothetical protein DCS28_00265 [Candidatus Moranbacteria bacterium]|nr:hypothetical protein [Candidatus Moranbacteria bacterium]HAT74467.1 hypothetical protein [Candidatus Moranbacteria bacterium]